MNDHELDDALREAAQHWRVPIDPPLDAIWDAVATEAFRPRARRSPGWPAVGIAAAAALAIGVAGGRYWAGRATVPIATTAAAPHAVAATAAVNDPSQQAMGELLGRTAVLLAALPAESSAPAVDPQLSREGARLLTTTRLLLDAPIGADPRLRNLLQDLELVLAQVARLEPEHRRDEIQFIRTAVDEHDIVPRLRTAAADLTHDDF
ncbi:MAG TPA: hypothetical protein VGL65_13595 [Gemmatimonadales bacterium]|jgi:hypothetical protein